MITAALSFLKALGLSAQEYLFLALASAISALILAFELQGSRLHKAQVQLMDQRLKSKGDRLAQATQNDKDAFRDALNSFIRAGGTFLLFMGLLTPHSASSAPPGPTLAQCEHTLGLCSKVVGDQDSQIKDLQYQVAQWKKEAYKGQSDPSVLFGSVIAGGLGGAGVEVVEGDGTTGVFRGAIVGIAVGLTIGLLMEALR